MDEIDGETLDTSVPNTFGGVADARDAWRLMGYSVKNAAVLRRRADCVLIIP